MNISDILRISIVGLSTFGMIHLARQDKHASRNNPRTKTIPTEAEIDQAKSLLAQTPQVIVDTIVLERSKNLTSKQISMLIGYTTQQVWDILKALKVLNIYVPEKRLVVDLSERMTPEVIRSLHEVYMGTGRPKLEEVAKIANVSASYLFKQFEKLQLATKRPSIVEIEEARVRALFAEYTGPDLPTLVTLAKTAGMDAHTLRRRFQALGLQAKIYGRTPARNVKLANPGIDFDELYADFQNIKISLAMLEGKYHCNLNQIIQALEYYDYPVEGKRFSQFILRNTVYTDQIVEKYNSGMNIYEVYESLKDTLSLSLVVILAARSSVIFRDTEPVVQYYLQGYSINRIQILTKLTYNYDMIRVILQNVGLLPSKDSETTKSVRQVIAPPPPKTSEELELEKTLPLVSQSLIHRIPKEKILELQKKGLTFAQMRKELDISLAYFADLRRFYNIK